jgi:four helix bundle protein
VTSAHKYQDLIAWQLSMELCELVSDVVRTGNVAADFRLRDQIRSAAQSAPALIAEGFIRFTPEEFVHYLRMARAEIGELQTHLETARRQGLLSDEQLARIVPIARRTMAITTKLLKSKLPLLKKKRGTTW